MKRNLLSKTLMMLIATFAATSCVDDNYDLSDIDTTTRINVTDLTVPVNIDPVTMGDIIKIDNGSKIQVVNIDGKEFYALSQDGDFHSDAITIQGVKASPSPINDTHETLDRLINPQSKRAKLPAMDFTYEMVEIGNQFSYNAINIDPSIVSLEEIETAPFKFGLNLEIKDPQGMIESMDFTDLKIRVPKGLTARTSVGTYDSASGIWSIPSVRVSKNVVPVSLTATGVNMLQAGASILPDHSLDFRSEFVIEKGKVTIVPTGVFVLPDQVELIVRYDLDNLDIKSFTGKIQYELDGINIAPVSLSDIPDFLRGGDTNISLANPQIYLQVNNPLANVPLNCTTGLQLTAERSGLPTLYFQPEQLVEIGTVHGIFGPYNYVLTPEGDHLTTPPDFAQNLQRVKFNTLGNLLATPADWSRHGLPDKIGISLINPNVPLQHVSRFAIPQTLSEVRGRYQLVAPLALCDGSHVVYTETRTGWSTEDLEDLTVTALTVSAHVDNQCPAAAQVYIYPIDVDGREIDGVSIQSSRLAPGQQSDLVIEMTGEVKRLDGVRIVAVLEGHDGSSLAPSQTLTFTDIRAKVSGYYQRKL